MLSYARPFRFLALICAMALVAFSLRAEGFPTPRPADTSPLALPKGMTELTVILPEDFPPFVSVTEGGGHEGLRVDMWSLWSQRTGVPVRLIFKPFPQVLETMEKGGADVADVISPTPDRRAWLDFGPEYDQTEVALYFKPALVGLHDLPSARGLTVGALSRSVCENALKDAGVETRGFPSIHDLIYTAVIGQLPVFCLQTTPAEYLLAQAGLESQYRRTEPFTRSGLHWTVAKGNRAVADLVSDGFELITPAETAEVRARWQGGTLPALFSISPATVLRVLELLALIILVALGTVLLLRRRLGRALARQAEVELRLRQRIREQSCLHGVFLATDDMQRPMPDILRDIAEALRKGWPGPGETRIRIELLGYQHDEIGDPPPPGTLIQPIVIEGRERGRILIAGPSDPPKAESDLLLGLAASRIAGRALGQTTLAMLRKSEERFRSTFMHSAQATAIAQGGRFVGANRAALAMLGYNEDETFVGKTPGEISPPFQPDGQPSDIKARLMGELALKQGNHKFEWEHLRRDGEPILLEVLLTAVTEDGRTDFYVLWNDITVKRQAEAALAAYQQTLEAQVAKRTQQLSTLYEELQAIFTTASAGIALVRDGVIVTCNPSLGKILLWPHEDLIGTGSRAFFKDDASFAADRDAANASIAAGEVHERIGEMVRFDGSTVWVRIRGVAVDSGNLAKGAVWVVEDISAERAAQVKLAEARDIAEQAARLKSEFLAHISHELRSPINAVLGFTELLGGTKLDKLQRDFVQKVQSSGRHLLLIINDVLDLSKVEAGKLAIEKVEFPLAPTLRSAVDTVTPGAAERDLELILSIDPDLPLRLLGDPLRVTQILVNYLTNAVKFTKKGSITLSAQRTADPAGAPLLRLAVADTGIGMTQDQLARMFQSFSQAEDSISRLYGGTGLGLAICRQLADLMGGEVGVTSQLGEGTTFWVTLPLHPVEAPAAPPRQPRLTGQQVLIAEDHPAAAAQIAAILRAEGAEPVIAETGEMALAMVAADPPPERLPDALVIDITLPDMDGIATIRALRDRLGATMPPVILMARQGGQSLVDLTLSEGIEDLMVKPVDPEILIDKLQHLVGPVRLRPRGTRRASRGRIAAPPAASAALLPHAGRRALVVDDHPLNRELAAAMLSRLGVSVQTAVNGAEALERVLDSDFDLILMDNQMPVMTGLEATRRIRALPTAKALTPIIGVTGKADDEDRRSGTEAGMDDYLIKPISPQHLAAALDRWLSQDTLSPAQ